MSQGDLAVMDISLEAAIAKLEERLQDRKALKEKRFPAEEASDGKPEAAPGVQPDSHSGGQADQPPGHQPSHQPDQQPSHQSDQQPENKASHKTDTASGPPEVI